MDTLEFLIYAVAVILLCPLTWVIGLQFAILVIWDRPARGPAERGGHIDDDLYRAFWDDEDSGGDEVSEAGRYRPAITAVFGYLAACIILVGVAIFSDAGPQRLPRWAPHLLLAVVAPVAIAKLVGCLTNPRGRKRRPRR